MSNEWGKLLAEYRARAGLSLRDLRDQYNFDPGNWSKLERGERGPPQDPNRLREMMSALDVEDEQEFMDLAAIGRGDIPDDLLSNESTRLLLPSVFRTLRKNH